MTAAVHAVALQLTLGRGDAAIGAVPAARTRWCAPSISRRSPRTTRTRAFDDAARIGRVALRRLSSGKNAGARRGGSREDASRVGRVALERLPPSRRVGARLEADALATNGAGGEPPSSSFASTLAATIETLEGGARGRDEARDEDERDARGTPASPALSPSDLGSNPMGKAALGAAGKRWIEAVASDAAAAFVRDAEALERDGGDARSLATRAGASDFFVAALAPFVEARPPPKNRREACLLATTHAPTAGSFFNRAVRDAIGGDGDGLEAHPARVALRRGAKRRKRERNEEERSSEKTPPKDSSGSSSKAKEKRASKRTKEPRGKTSTRPDWFASSDTSWRRAKTSEVSARVAAYCDAAVEMLALEREAEAASAAAMLEQERDATISSAEEGTTLGRLGAMMDGLRLTSATGDKRGKTGTTLFSLSTTPRGAALPPSAINVGDRVAVVVAESDVRDAVDDEDPGTSDSDSAAFSSACECAVRSIDPANGEVTLALVEGGGDDVAERLAGEALRLVRVPDAVTYERQLEALRRLRNVPTSRTNPPAAAIVRSLFAASRCPVEGEGVRRSGDAGVSDAERALSVGEPKPEEVLGYFASAPGASVAPRVTYAEYEHLPSLDESGAAGPLPADFDDAQALAVRVALTRSAPVVWIQGPPGTGKTRVVVEIIRRAVASGQRVLACAPSNAAVDNLVERLAELDDGVLSADDIVRVGDPERISSAALGASLDARVSENTAAYFDKARQSRRSEILAAERRGWSKQGEMRMEERRKKGKGKKKNDPDPTGDLLREELSRLRKERRNLAKSGKKVRAAAEREILQNARVVLATTVGAGAEGVQKLPAFDLAVLDEAAQATEPAAWIPLVRCKRVALVGDPRQLAPLVRSPDAARRGLAETLMSRVATPQQMAKKANRDRPDGSDASSSTFATPTATFSAGVLGCALETQYRSHAKISDWASRAMYDGALRASPSAATRTLSELPGVRTTRVTETPLLFLDTRTEGGILLSRCEEINESGLARKGAMGRRAADESDKTGVVGADRVSSSSLVNEGEAYAVTMHVVGLLNSGVMAKDIAVQSPYAAQVRLIQERLIDAQSAGLHPDASLVEVASVDSFQGREAEAVIVSTVRCNERRAVGFLADVRRANVAVTRARRHVCVVGDSVTVGSDPFLRGLIDHLRENGTAATANEIKGLHEAAE